MRRTQRWSVEREHEGRVAVVTGAGRGLGLAFAHAFAGRGALVAVVDIAGDAAQRAAYEIRATGGAASGFTCDVAAEEQVAAMMTAVAARHGGTDIPANNAGPHSEEYNEPMTVAGLAKLRRLFDVHVLGVVTCTLLAVPYMSSRPKCDDRQHLVECVVHMSHGVRGVQARGARPHGGLGSRARS